MPVRTFTTFTDLTRCTYDHHIEVVDEHARLKPRMLVADDVGAITSRTHDVVADHVWAKKTFLLGFADVKAAEVVIRTDPQGHDPAAETTDQTLIVEINGQTIEHEYQRENVSFQGKPDSYWSAGWQIVPIPAKALKAGANDIVIRSGSGKGWRLYVDNTRHHHRSAKSIDGGKTWTTERLGRNDFCIGEYVVRLNLHRHAPSGTITSSPIDLAATAGDGPIAPRIAVKSVCFTPDATVPRGTAISLQWRSGTTPSYGPETWSPWQDITGPVSLPKSHRFVQWRATLTTARGDATPALRQLEVEISGEMTKPAHPSLRVVEAHNDDLVPGSYPFAYQLTDEPRLTILRERWRLDHVVAGAKTEFEKFLRLKRWTRQQWEDGWNRGTLQFVPPWDALVVLELASQQLSLGMCTHYASTFVQACLSLGLQARVCIITSHCVAEVWSNEHRKWVMIDPGCDFDDGRKGTRHFERHGVPMSALDLHKAFVHDDFDGVAEVNDPEQFGNSVRENAALYRQFCTTLRNNFLTSLYPEEPEHGAVSYTYDGHVWYESSAMPLPQFSMTSRRDGDFTWSLNQTHISVQQGSEPHTVTVLLDTVTPNFQTYLVQTNDGTWRESE
ncbi:MAG: transglutaminase domain-containing protein, partial [Candidatus Latescibacteria bacterium]|nr:transglutaminase domain-containing protein [Candidatus Latescibacterota bacterium]